MSETTMSDYINRDDAVKAISREIRLCHSALARTYGACFTQVLYSLPSADVVERNQWIPCSERLPDELEPVNITWVNRNPMSYYEDIKDKSFSGAAIYYNNQWWWYSCICEDLLAEYGKSACDKMDKGIEVIAWMPLPEPYKADRNLFQNGNSSEKPNNRNGNPLIWK